MLLLLYLKASDIDRSLCFKLETPGGAQSASQMLEAEEETSGRSHPLLGDAPERCFPENLALGAVIKREGSVR